LPIFKNIFKDEKLRKEPGKPEIKIIHFPSAVSIFPFYFSPAAVIRGVNMA